MARHLEQAVALAAWLMLNPWMTASAADEVVGSVLAARGAVFSDAAAGQQLLVVNAVVHRGDAIVTLSGKAKIALRDGSIISIGENSRVRLADYAGKGSSAKITIQLFSGVLRPLVSRTTSSGSFEVETETAIAAVRGTDWVIEATPERTSVAVVSGVVAVTSRADRRATEVLRLPGHGTDVLKGSPPTPAVPWGIKRLAEVLARATFD